jgi:hypothetical protein
MSLSLSSFPGTRHIAIVVASNICRVATGTAATGVRPLSKSHAAGHSRPARVSQHEQMDSFQARLPTQPQPPAKKVYCRAVGKKIRFRMGLNFASLVRGNDNREKWEAATVDLSSCVWKLKWQSQSQCWRHHDRNVGMLELAAWVCYRRGCVTLVAQLR